MNIHSAVARSAAVAPLRTVTQGKHAKREAILVAALRLFSERGFHGTTVPDVAKAANVGAGTVYRNFESKEALVNHLYQKHKTALGARIASRIDEKASPREQFHVYWHSMVEFAREQPHAYNFLNLHHHAPYLDETSREIEGTLVLLALTRFEAFRKLQVVKDVDPMILIAIIHGSFVGLVKACAGDQLVFSLDAVDSMEQCVWEAIRL